MVGADESTELWQPPICQIMIYFRTKLKIEFEFIFQHFTYSGGIVKGTHA